MFTGIITDRGKLVARDGGRMVIACGYDPATIEIGASIACDGCCLTVTKIDARGSGCSFHVDVSNETLEHTTLGAWSADKPINLERAMALGDELGGHIVTGHVDAVAEIVGRRSDGDSVRFQMDCPDGLAHLIAPKGSVALDGVSLTVNEVEGARFGVNIIPHTLSQTSWGTKQEGDHVNLEVDLLARYVARMQDVRNAK